MVNLINTAQKVTGLNPVEVTIKMELKEKLISSFMAFEERVDVTADLHDIRTSAIKNFENKGFPTKKEEAWKYTSLNTLLKNDFSVFPKKENAVEFAEVKKYFLHFGQVLALCFFGIALQARVHGHVYFQPVFVHIVCAAIGLFILCKKSFEPQA